jgi:predicted Zn-dependent peptidase
MVFSIWFGVTTSNAHLWSLKRNFDQTFDLALDVVLRPRFDAERLATLKGQYIEGMRRRDESPGRAAAVLLNRVIFKDHPRLGYVAQREEIEAVTADQVRAIWKRHLGRDNLYITAVGDFDSQEMLELLESKLGSWREAEESERKYITHEPFIKPGVYVVEQELPQPAVRIYHQIDVDRTAPAEDHAALEILNDILGGSGFRSRLMERLRSDEGLTYGIYSSMSHQGRPDVPGNLRIGYQTKHESVAQSIDSVLEEVQKVIAEQVGPAEVEEQIEAWRNRFVFRFTNDFYTVLRLMLNELDDRPYDFDRIQLEQVQKVTVKHVQRVAKKYLKPKNLTVAVFGSLTAEDKARLTCSSAATTRPRRKKRPSPRPATDSGRRSGGIMKQWRPSSIALGLSLLGLSAGWVDTAAADAEGSRVTFLDAQQAAVAIINDGDQPYFELLRPLEMSAKTGAVITGNGLAEQRAECRRRYAEATLDFSTDEIAAIVWVVSEIQPHLRRRYPRVAQLGWSFIKVHSHIEGGMPHTRGSHIVVSAKMLKSYVETLQRGRTEKMASMGTWLLHEQLHVLQRHDPQLFHRLYTELLGFKRVESVGRHEWLADYQLANPDALDTYWIYPVRHGERTTWIWPTVVLAESSGVRRLLGVPSMRRDRRMVAVELEPHGEELAIRVENTGRPVVHNLLSFQEYRKQFPFSVTPFHPNEIAAEGFARIAISEIVLSRERETGQRKVRPDPKTEALGRWFAENLH